MLKYIKNFNRFGNLWGRLKPLFFLHLQLLPIFAGHYQRPLIAKLGGVKIEDPLRTFLGEGILFDTEHPDLIIIESGVRITMRSIILTHYFEPATGHYTTGKVHIKKKAFIGAGSIITKPVTIGEYAVVGAGSVVTKDIPDGEVWAGNPARFIKKRDL